MWFVGLSLVGFVCSFHLVVLLRVFSFSDLGFRLVHAHFLSPLAVVVGFVLEWCMTRGFRGLLGPFSLGFGGARRGAYVRGGVGFFCVLRFVILFGSSSGCLSLRILYVALCPC